MTATIAYELYAFRDDAWILDSVHDDKEMALYEARRLVENQRSGTVQVIEERFDSDSGCKQSKVVFRVRRGTRKGNKQAIPDSHNEPCSVRLPERPKTRKPGVFRYLVFLLLSIGGLSLSVIVGMIVILDLVR